MDFDDKIDYKKILKMLEKNIYKKTLLSITGLLCLNYSMF